MKTTTQQNNVRSAGADHNGPFALRTASTSLCLLSLAALLAFGAVSQRAHAADVTWNPAGSDVFWNNGANWIGGTAPANDTTTNTANFTSGTYSFQPSLNADTQQAINGLIFSSTDGAPGAGGAQTTISAATSSGTSSGSTSLGSSTINLSSIGSHVTGEELTGFGIAPGTFITGISGNQVTLSNATTAAISSGAALTFTPTLTIGSSGIVVNANNHSIQKITAPVVLAGSQTWTNNSTDGFSNYLVATHVFIGGSQTLTINAVAKDFNNVAFRL